MTLPGHWRSPQGPPRWGRVVGLDAGGHERDPPPVGTVKLAAAEIVFPDSDWHLAIKLAPPQAVTFNGTAIRFTNSSLTGDNLQVGFCRSGSFDHWCAN